MAGCRRQTCLVLLFLLITALLTSTARGQLLAPTLEQAMCRISCRVGEATSLGSGTLIDVARDRSQGLVLTCAHLFTDGIGEIVVDFPGVRSHGGRLVAIDTRADLAAVVIANPRVNAVPLADPADIPNELVACGFGGQGNFRAIRGPVVGHAKSPGQENVLIRGAVRSGDSGGAVLNQAGQLAAVVWGTADGVTYATTGAPLARFLGQVLPTSTVQTASCPNGMCPRQPLFSRPQIVQPIRPQTPQVTREQLDQLAERIARLEQTKQDRGDYALRNELQQFVPQETWHSFTQEHNERLGGVLAELKRLAASRAVGTAVATTLGISGPAGWAIVAASMLGGTLLGHTWLGMRLRIRGARGRRGRPFRNAPTA